MVGIKKSSDSAKGPSSGYIYQFEVALLELAQLNIGESISIEKVDDVAKEDEKGTYLCTIQTKHSITLSGTNFGNTSDDLWKTIIIWVNKINEGIINKNTKFTAITNKKIPNNSIVRDFKKLDFDKIFKKVEDLKAKQLDDYNEKISNGKKGTSLKKTIERLKTVISNKDVFETIVKNFEFKEGMDDVKELFLNRLNIVTIESKEKKDSIYQEFLGWISDTSKENWKNKKEAKFQKKDFDKKYRLIFGNHTLVDAIFRTKKSLESSNVIDADSFDKNRIFIKQLEDIDREFNEEIIKDAIIDFILCDIELTHFITSEDGNYLTKSDFDEFEKKCHENWDKVKKKHIIKKINLCSLEELNEIACKIYNEIMYELKVDFQDFYGFNDSNRYFQNGTFLKLSDIPTLGWHPEWKKKYSN